MAQFLETSESLTAIGLLVCVAAAGFAIAVFPAVTPWAAVLPPVVLSGTIHTPRVHGLILGAALGAVMVASSASGDIKTDGIGACVSVCAVGAVTMWRCAARARAGVQGSRGEEMLVDLRQMLLGRGCVPPLPEPWRVRTCVESAFGQPFSGDFVVTRRTCDGRLLELVLVDVSGKGLDAGSRALALSGGFDALLGSVAPRHFLTAANDYVVRQDWSEGFATAVYVCLDVTTGEYLVSGAGHPPAIRFAARAALSVGRSPARWHFDGPALRDVDQPDRAPADQASGAWEPITGAGGPALGLLPDVAYPTVEGVLCPGEALVLYTDGLIEDRGTSIDEGVQHLVADLDRLAAEGFEGIPARACGMAAAGQADDRGVVVLWHA